MEEAGRTKGESARARSGKARQAEPETRMVIGDVIRPETLFDAVDAVDAVVLTLRSDGSSSQDGERRLRRRAQRPACARLANRRGYAVR